MTMLATDPRDNARKITKILVDRAGSADLYRTITAGPSGQRASVCVGHVAYTWEGPFEVQVFTPEARAEAGYAKRDEWKYPGMWTVWESDGSGGTALLGRASSLSLAADVLVNGPHVAMGRHDSARTSPGKWIPYQP